MYNVEVNLLAGVTDQLIASLEEAGGLLLKMLMLIYLWTFENNNNNIYTKTDFLDIV